MEKLITMENLRNFAYVNDRICKKPIQGIIRQFFGRGFMCMYDKNINCWLIFRRRFFDFLHL